MRVSGCDCQYAVFAHRNHSPTMLDLQAPPFDRKGSEQPSGDNCREIVETIPRAINDSGAVVGYFLIEEDGPLHVISATAAPISFDMPTSLAAPMGTLGAGINNRGHLVGYFLRLDQSGSHWFRPSG
jgi:hypothetical protein